MRAGDRLAIGKIVVLDYASGGASGSERGAEASGRAGYRAT
ncbi:MAG: hypothetical protein AAF725_05090 [Acidobacteriota bacterium]